VAVEMKSAIRWERSYNRGLERMRTEGGADRVCRYGVYRAPWYPWDHNSAGSVMGTDGESRRNSSTLYVAMTSAPAPLSRRMMNAS